VSRITLGVYVHLPFCRRRCSYCAFAISVDLRRQQQYQSAILAEISECTYKNWPVDTVFFGGGTPSLTATDLLLELMGRLRASFEIASSAEVSMEVNPEDVSPEPLAAWLRGGVTRVSIGVQSFEDAELHPLGRSHAAELARQAVRQLVASGVRVSLDLILGLPGQTLSSFRKSVTTALESGAGHLSLYMLDLEPGSALEAQVQANRVRLPEEEETADMYLSAIEAAEQAGFRQYEISNFARPGQECLHNLKYWNRQPYIGFGLGAHSFVGNERWANSRDLDAYLQRAGEGTSAVAFRETLGPLERARESLLLGLRQKRGLRYSELLQLRGEEASEWVSRGILEGWLHSSSDRVAFTPSGFLLSNEYISQLF
jgi:putative oxygen-independent coproporphyrinogen III oxidase